MKTRIALLALMAAGPTWADNGINPTTTVSVKVTNPSLNVTVTNPVDSVKAQMGALFQQNLFPTTNSGVFCGGTYAVPAGKKLQITNVYFRLVTVTALMMYGEVDVKNATTGFQAFFNAIPGVVSKLSGVTTFVGGQAVSVEADGGSTVSVGVDFDSTDSSPGTGCDIGISGLLVDSP